MKTVAIIVSAGKGQRISNKTPKQYMKIKSNPLICYTLSVFETLPYIDGIVLVVARDKVDYCKRLTKKYNFTKVFKIIPGGSTRQKSVYNGLKALSSDTKIVVVHDGVRPLVSKGLIDRVVNNAKRYGAAIPSVLPKATIKVTERNWINNTLPRNRLAEIQTPQAFRYSILKDSYRKCKNKLDKATDTSFIIEQAGYKVRAVEGAYKNIKVTTKEDLDFVSFLLESPVAKVGIGYDIHKLSKNRRLILGGVCIPGKAGLLGHSDADVLLHALTDAILGAIGERDIGWYFPDTDTRYKNMKSSNFLLKARKLMENKKYKILNIDSIIIAETPRLQPYYKDMVNNIAKWVKLPRDRITIKFKTAEELGPLGNKEAIAVLALTTIGKK